MTIDRSPPNVRLLRVARSIPEAPGDTALATLTPAISSGDVPNELDRRMRRRVPPMLTRTSCRSVTSFCAVAGSAFGGSTSICALAQVPTQRLAVGGAAAAQGLASAAATAANSNDIPSLI